MYPQTKKTMQAPTVVKESGRAMVEALQWTRAQPQVSENARSGFQRLWSLSFFACMQKMFISMSDLRCAAFWVRGNEGELYRTKIEGMNKLQA
jgi:hypothetical protein